MKLRTARIDFLYTDEAMAKAIFDIFFFQYSEALSDEISARHELAAAEAANKAYEDEWRREDGLGWCSRHPFPDHQIKYKKQEVENSKKELKDAKELMMFVRDRFLEKFSKQITDKQV
jgi:hypothetical protein